MQGTVTTSQKGLETRKHSFRPFPHRRSLSGLPSASLELPRHLQPVDPGFDHCAATAPAPKQGAASRPAGMAGRPATPARKLSFRKARCQRCPAYAGQRPSHPSSTSVADRRAPTWRVSG